MIKPWTTAVNTKRLIWKFSKVIVPKNLITSAEHFWGYMEYSVELCFPCKIKRQNKPQKWYFYFIDIRVNGHPQLWCFLNYTAKVSAQIVLILSDSLMKCRKLYCYTIGSSILFFPGLFHYSVQLTLHGTLKVNSCLPFLAMRRHRGVPQHNSLEDHVLTMCWFWKTVDRLTWV